MDTRWLEPGFGRAYACFQFRFPHARNSSRWSHAAPCMAGRDFLCAGLPWSESQQKSKNRKKARDRRAGSPVRDAIRIDNNRIRMKFRHPPSQRALAPTRSGIWDGIWVTRLKKEDATSADGTRGSKTLGARIRWQTHERGCNHSGRFGGS